MVRSGVAGSPAVPGLAHILRGARGVSLVVFATLAALGALLAPGALLLLGAVIAAAGYAAGRALLEVQDAGLRPPPHPAKAAAGAAVLPAAFVGAEAIGPAALAVLATGLMVAAVVAALRWAGSSTPPPTRRRTAAEDEASLRQLLPALPVDVLCEEWRGSSIPAGGDGGAGSPDARFRRLVVDELRRRDPDGTTRWLSEDPGSPPDGYVRDSGDRTP